MACTLGFRQPHRNGASRAVCVASGLIDEVPGKDGGVLTVSTPIDGVHPPSQRLGVVLVQLHDLGVGEEVHVVCDTSKLVVQVHALHPVVNERQNDLQETTHVSCCYYVINVVVNGLGSVLSTY